MLKRIAHRPLSQHGFTLIELMLAMGFFTFVILMSTFALVQLGNEYQRTQSERSVQNAARVIMDDVVRTIRNANVDDVVISDGYVDPATSTFRVCVGSSTRYGWNMSLGGGDLSYELYDHSPSEPVLRFVKNTASAATSCTDPISQHPSDGSFTTALLESGMGVQYFDVERIGTSSSFRIKLVVSTYVDTPQFRSADFSTSGEDATCQPGAGIQFCAVAELETVVTARN